MVKVPSTSLWTLLSSSLWWRYPQHRYQHYCLPHYGEGTSLSTLLSSSLWWRYPQHRYQHCCLPHYGEDTLSIVINSVVFLTVVKIPSASLSTLLFSSLWWRYHQHRYHYGEGTSLLTLLASSLWWRYHQHRYQHYCLPDYGEDTNSIVINMKVHRYEHYGLPHYGVGIINIVVNIIVFLTLILTKTNQPLQPERYVTCSTSSSVLLGGDGTNNSSKSWTPTKSYLDSRCMQAFTSRVLSAQCCGFRLFCKPRGGCPNHNILSMVIFSQITHYESLALSH